MRLGWRRDSLSPGTVVTVEGFRSKTEEFVASARSVTLSDGGEVFVDTLLDFRLTEPPPATSLPSP
jgi:hypothetical protein